MGTIRTPTCVTYSSGCRRNRPAGSTSYCHIAGSQPHRPDHRPVVKTRSPDAYRSTHQRLRARAELALWRARRLYARVAACRNPCSGHRRPGVRPRAPAAVARRTPGGAAARRPPAPRRRTRTPPRPAAHDLFDLGLVEYRAAVALVAGLRAALARAGPARSPVAASGAVRQGRLGRVA